MAIKFSHMSKVDRLGRVMIIAHNKAEITRGKLYSITPDVSSSSITIEEYKPECFFCASRNALIYFGDLIQKDKPKYSNPSEYICSNCLLKLKHARKNGNPELSIQSNYLRYCIRKIDKRGGFVLPHQIICQLKITPWSKPIFTQACSDAIDICFPYQNHCFFCGSDEVHLIFKNTPLCKSCLQIIKSIKP